MNSNRKGETDDCLVRPRTMNKSPNKRFNSERKKPHLVKRAVLRSLRDGERRAGAVLRFGAIKPHLHFGRSARGPVMQIREIAKW